MSKWIASGAFRVEDMKLIRPAPPPDDPPLRMGCWCRLTCGGQRMLVVDEAASGAIAVGLPNGVECEIPRASVRRTSAAD